MYKYLLCLTLFVCCLSLSLNADQISGFNYATDTDAQNDWTVGFFDSGTDSGSIATSTADKQEGISSLKMTYNYNGNQWYYMKVTKTFSPFLDISSAKRFSMWVKGDPAANDDCLWYIRFLCANGRALRYVHGDTLDVDGTWKQVSFDMIDAERDPFSGTYTDCVTLSDIENVEIIVEQVTGNTNTGTATVYFDDLRFETDSDYIGIGEIDYFEYPSSTELQAAWSVALPTSPSGFDLQLISSTEAAEGSKSMQMDVTLVSNWLNCWALKTYDPIIDLTDADHFIVWIKGDPTNIGTRSPIMFLYLEDDTINRVYALLNYALKKDGWTCYYLDANYDSDGEASSTNATFWQDRYDNGGECDITRIKKIALAVQDNQNPAGDTYSFSILADGLVYAVRTSGPPPTSSNPAWNIYE